MRRNGAGICLSFEKISADEGLQAVARLWWQCFSFSIEQTRESRHTFADEEELHGKPAGGGGAPLNPVEVEVIHLFVQLSRALGQPPSIAEIYGLLFVSLRPMPQDEFYDRLNMSKGAASQGLRYLLDLGAVRTVYVSADRRVHYEAVAELRKSGRAFPAPADSPQFWQDSGSRLARASPPRRRSFPARSAKQRLRG